MKYGARNKLKATVTSVKKGDVMALVKFQVTDPGEMASVLTTESVGEFWASSLAMRSRSSSRPSTSCP